MALQDSLHGLFHQLNELLERLSPADYSQPIGLLSGATLGQHFRHMIECLQELEKGYPEGLVNYDLRKRHLVLETDVDFARLQLATIGAVLDRPDKPLVLEATVEGGVQVRLASSYDRELHHHLDHMVHHMALIRVGLLALDPILLPESFGVAYATMRSRASQSSIFTN